MLSPGAYLIWIALGALLTAALDAASDLTTEAQFITMAIASGLSCFGGYFVYRHGDRRKVDRAALNERAALLVGERGVVSSEIVGGTGKVRLGDTVWLAEGPDLPVGAAVIVSSVRRARVLVSPLTAAGRVPENGPTPRADARL
jgi:membrane protein implicated in regulation of membrane protease activity